MIAEELSIALVGELDFPVSLKGQATPGPSEIGIVKIPPLINTARGTMIEPGSVRIEGRCDLVKLRIPKC